MSIVHTLVKYWRSTVGSCILALTVAMLIGGVAPTPAFSQAHERHSWHQERAREAREGRREQRREWRREQRRGYSRHGYYAPPPGFYAPAPSPGINLFFHIP